MSTILIPTVFFDSKYDAAKYPGSGECDGIQNGANCQYFVYEILRHFGYDVPDLRSSELWEDSSHTDKVESFKPLDILFFNKDSNPYGAHLGLYLGANKAIHLSKEVGYPAIWDLEEFGKRDQYSFLLGGKRMRRR
jgi:cell wall-associated NlpC family hydrolase